MKITYMGHACFLLESGGYRLMLDPYQDLTGLEDISGEVNQVLCSHNHFDHNYTDRLVITEAPSPFTLQKVSVFHDEEGGRLRGTNLIHCVSAEGLRVVHLGDLGHLLTEDQIQPLFGCDILCLPVGGTYTVDSAQACRVMEQLRPRIVIPMHYFDGTHGVPGLEPVEHFLSLCDGDLVRCYDSATLTISADTPAQVAVLSFPG